jgi:uncharacterized repeat protein (TIGR01451 family)
MKTRFSNSYSILRKRVAAGALIALAIALPAASAAASTVKLEANSTVANASKGGSWAGSTTASYNQVVDVQVVYNNTEAANSGKVAKNLQVKINIPTTAGKAQTITTKTNADNTNTVNGSVKVNLDRADAYLQYIPGTATWKHASTANGPMGVTQKVSDDVVLGTNGANLGNENPCQAGSIQIQARVIVPGLSVDKFVRPTGTTQWSTKITAKSGDVVQYEIAYKNTGNAVQKNVAVRDQLPKGVTYVPGSTKLMNTSYPKGTAVSSNEVVKDGILVGTYAPGATAFVMFDAKVDAAALSCGNNTVRNIAYVQPQGINYYYNTADVLVSKTCTTPTTPNAPRVACTAFAVTQDNAKKSVVVSKFTHTQDKNAPFANVVIDWGDHTTPMTTNNALGQSHSYAVDGTYAITTTSHFTVNGKDVTAAGCTQTVTFTSTPTATPPTATTPTQELPHTGAAQVFSLFGATVVMAAVAHRLFARRLSRQ